MYDPKFRSDLQPMFPTMLNRGADDHLALRLEDRYYSAGRDAFIAGMPLNTNPNRRNSRAFTAWARGHYDGSWGRYNGPLSSASEKDLQP